MAKTAFNASRLNAFAFNPEDLVIVGLDTEDDHTHPLYDPRILDPVSPELVANVGVYGVIEPIVVAKDGDRALVVDGRQRVRAAREANERIVEAGGDPIRVAAVRHQGSDERLFAVMVSANEQRRDDDPMAKAAKLCRFLEMGRSEQEAAVAFGVTVQTIRNWSKLLECSPAVRAAIAAGQIAPTAGSKLARFSREEQDEKLEELLSPGKKVTVRDTEAEVGDRPRKPGKRFLTKLVELEGPHDLPEGFLEGVRYAMGDLHPEEVEGLQAAIHAATGGE